MTSKYLNALKTVMDPELPINIVDLGLIYKVKEKDGVVDVTMTLTTPGCPMSPVFEAMIKKALKKFPEVKKVKVNLTFEPMWDAAKMSMEAKKALGF